MQDLPYFLAGVYSALHRHLTDTGHGSYPDGRAYRPRGRCRGGTKSAACFHKRVSKRRAKKGYK